MWDWFFSSDASDDPQSDDGSDESSVVSSFSCSTFSCSSESSLESFDNSIKQFHSMIRKSIRWDDERQGREDEIEQAKTDPSLKCFIDMVSDIQGAIRMSDDQQIQVEMEKLIKVVLADKSMRKHAASAHYVSLMKEYENYNLRKNNESPCPRASDTDDTDDSDDDSVSSFPAVSKFLKESEQNNAQKKKSKLSFFGK